MYITICALIWARGNRIKIELLQRHSVSHGNKVLASLARLETARKIVRNGPEISQKRAEKELKNAQKRVRAARDNALKRWQNNDMPNTTANAPAHPPALPPHNRPQSAGNANHQPSTIKESNPKPLSKRGFEGSDRGGSTLTPRQRGTNPRATHTNGSSNPHEEPWQQRLKAFNENGFWNPFWGPKPNEPGYAGPACP